MHIGVIAGHSHKPRNEWIGDVLYFNPGGAGLVLLDDFSKYR